jgi:DNA-binding SARP family transcriptional activator
MPDHREDRTQFQGSAESAALAVAALQHFPTGVLVLDSEGAIVAVNPLAVALLADAAQPPERGRRCCDVLCGAGEWCVTELALESDGPLPEVRIDLPEGAEPGAVWVTAARTDGASPNVIVQARPGAAKDRRRRTEPHWIHGPQLRISVLGETRIASGEGSFSGDWLRQRPGQLLKLLVCERPHLISTERLAEALWPDGGRSSLNNVRYSVHALRQRLEPQRAKRATSSFILASGGGYGLDMARVEIDADDFERWSRAGLETDRHSDPAGAVRALEQAADLYRGEFLADEPWAEWAIGERDRLRYLALRVLRTLADLELELGNLDAADGWLWRVVEIEPDDMGVHRDLIALSLRRGRRSDAVRRYTRLRQRMLRSFGEELDFELSDLEPSRPHPVRRSA